MRKPIIFTHTIGAEAAPLTDDRLIGDVDVMADAANEDPVTISCASGEIELAPGEVHVLMGCNLNEITVDGTEGEVVKVCGNTSI